MLFAKPLGRTVEKFAINNLPGANASGGRLAILPVGHSELISFRAALTLCALTGYGSRRDPVE